MPKKRVIYSASYTQKGLKNLKIFCVIVIVNLQQTQLYMQIRHRIRLNIDINLNTNYLGTFKLQFIQFILKLDDQNRTKTNNFI